MTIDNFRQLLALRYTAESVEEVNVFLARALKIQIGLQKQGVYDRLMGYIGGAVAVFVVVVSMDADLVVPGIAILVYLFGATVRACFNWKAIEEQNKELSSTEDSVRDYWKKVSRDRLENRVSMAIQNRKAAARLLESDSTGLDPEDKRLLEANVQFWGLRIQESEAMLEDAHTDDIWKGHDEKLAKIREWIKAESKARPILT